MISSWLSKSTLQTYVNSPKVVAYWKQKHFLDSTTWESVGWDMFKRLTNHLSKVVGDGQQNTWQVILAMGKTWFNGSSGP